jgi:hypothetical protein
MGKGKLALAASMVLVGMVRDLRGAPPVAPAPEDQTVVEAFKRTGVATPPARPSVELQKKLEASGALRAAIDKARVAIDSPPANRAAAIKDLVKTAGAPGGNIMEVLYLVFREAIREANEDKRYYLEKIQAANKAADAISKQLADLSQSSSRLADRERTDAGTPRSATREDLARRQKELDAAMDKARAERDEAHTKFSAADQKVNQLMEMLTQVVKTIHEQRTVGTKNNL